MLLEIFKGFEILFGHQFLAILVEPGFCIFLRVYLPESMTSDRSYVILKLHHTIIALLVI